MQSFQQGSFSHESLERTSPSFTNSLEPIQFHIGDQYLWQGFGFRSTLRLELGRNMKVHNNITIRIGQARRRNFGCAKQDSVTFETTKQLIDRLFQFLFMCFQDNFGVGRFFVGVVNASEMLQFSSSHIRVLSLGIALFQFLARDIQKDFIKGQSLFFMTLSHRVAILLIGRNETHQGNDSRIGKEGGQLSRSTHRFGSIILGKAQIAIDSRT
mmetsp:Transcript_13154/g.27288  ORF Transcript_13154/g.27288 Transcript_13154/m.27288 type:complete len:213 (+) Transcript_13154:323-961(+)